MKGSRRKAFLGFQFFEGLVPRLGRRWGRDFSLNMISREEM